MSDESDGKRQLGRLQLQRKQVAADELEDLVASLGRVSSGSSASLGPVSLGPTSAHGAAVELASDLPAELDAVIVAQQGQATVDLRRVAIPVAALRLVAREVAREQLALPIFVDAEHLYVAMADLNDKQLIGELEFTTGRTVRSFPATQGTLRDVIEAAYAAEAAGESVYRGTLAGLEGRLAPSDPPPAFLPAPAPAPDFSRVPEGAPRPFDDELSRPLSKLPTGGYALGQLDAGDSVLPPPSTQRQRILVVDDSDDIRRLLVRVFRDRDYEVFESATGQDALQKVRECAPDLMLLDAMLPDVHGFDVCRRIKASRRYGHIPVVMLSAVYRGWRFAEDLRRSYGVEAFLEKPFRIGDVVAAVEKALQGSGRSHPPDEAEVEGLAADQLKAGMDAYASGDVAAAVEHLKRGLTIDPLSFRLHYHLGLLYGKQENVFEAIQELETAVDLRSRDFSTLKNLAVLYQRAGFRLKATEMWERALGCAPDDATRTSIRNHLVSLL